MPEHPAHLPTTSHPSPTAGARRGVVTAAQGPAVPGPAVQPAEQPAILQYEQLVPARLLKRYKRFLGDVQLAGQAGEVTIHVPNTGPMTGLLDALPADALLSTSADPKRKYAHTLEYVKGAQVGWRRCLALVCRLLGLRDGA